MLNSNNKIQPDEQLLILFKSGDTAALEEIVHRYKDKIINFLYHYTGDFDDAEDIAQESFIRICKYIKELDDVKNFSSWFYNVAANEAKTKLKKKKRYISINELNEDEIYNLTVRFEFISEDEFDEYQIKLQYAEKAINLLEPIFKEVILLRYLENFDNEKIASVTGLPIGTVKSRVNRGTEKLNKFYTKSIIQKIYDILIKT